MRTCTPVGLPLVLLVAVLVCITLCGHTAVAVPLRGGEQVSVAEQPAVLVEAGATTTTSAEDPRIESEYQPRGPRFKNRLFKAADDPTRKIAISRGYPSRYVPQYHEHRRKNEIQAMTPAKMRGREHIFNPYVKQSPFSHHLFAGPAWMKRPLIHVTRPDVPLMWSFLPQTHHYPSVVTPPISNKPDPDLIERMHHTDGHIPLLFGQDVEDYNAPQKPSAVTMPGREKRAPVEVIIPVERYDAPLPLRDPNGAYKNLHDAIMHDAKIASNWPSPRTARFAEKPGATKGGKGSEHGAAAPSAVKKGSDVALSALPDSAPSSQPLEHPSEEEAYMRAHPEGDLGFGQHPARPSGSFRAAHGLPVFPDPDVPIQYPGDEAPLGTLLNPIPRNEVDYSAKYGDPYRLVRLAANGIVNLRKTSQLPPGWGESTEATGEESGEQGELSSELSGEFGGEESSEATGTGAVDFQS